MSMLTDLRARLVADASIQSAVGQEKDGSTYKVYFAPVKQGVKLPFIIIARDSEDAVPAYGGETGLMDGQVGIDCYASTNAAAVTIADAVRDSLSGFRGTMGSTTVRSMLVTSQTDARNDPADGGPDFDNFVPLSVRIFYARSVPAPT